MWQTFMQMLCSLYGEVWILIEWVFFVSIKKETNNTWTDETSKCCFVMDWWCNQSFFSPPLSHPFPLEFCIFPAIAFFCSRPFRLLCIFFFFGNKTECYAFVCVAVNGSNSNRNACIPVRQYRAEQQTHTHTQTIVIVTIVWKVPHTHTHLALMRYQPTWYRTSEHAHTSNASPP